LRKKFKPKKFSNKNLKFKKLQNQKKITPAEQSQNWNLTRRLKPSNSDYF